MKPKETSASNVNQRVMMDYSSWAPVLQDPYQIQLSVGAPQENTAQILQPRRTVTIVLAIVVKVLSPCHPLPIGSFLNESSLFLLVLQVKLCLTSIYARLALR